jgi:hypothetical protein
MSVSNQELAQALNEVADLLEAQEANRFRVRAYRNAADAIARHDRPLAEVLEQDGIEGLRQIAGIGDALARALAQLVHTGRLGLLDRLRGEAGGEALLATVPGIGRELASRVHEHLQIDTLEKLEVAAHDGRLDDVPGFGRRRVQAVQQSLAGRLGRRRRLGANAVCVAPPVTELLGVDHEYRTQAEQDKLPRIAPKRFNPHGEKWLPILHTKRNGRSYTAMFSNTAQAHELGKTRDWVVIYRDDAGGHGQWTAVTAQSGPLKGQRVIRGREMECAEAFSRSSPRENYMPDEVYEIAKG